MAYHDNFQIPRYDGTFTDTYEKSNSSLYLLYEQIKAAGKRVSGNFRVESLIESEIHEPDLEQIIKFSVATFR